MLRLSILIHPRRLWLWSKHKIEIEAASLALLPTPYSLDQLISIERPDIGQLEASALLKPENPTAGHVPFISKNDATDHALSAAEGLVLYSGGLWEQLHLADSHLASSLASAMGHALLTTANLSAGKAAANAILGSYVPPPLQSLVGTAVASCFKYAEQRCNDVLSATHVNVDAELLDPSHAVGDSPTEILTTHLSEHGVHLDTLHANQG